MLALDLTPAQAAVKLAAGAGLELNPPQAREVASVCEVGPDERWRHRDYRLSIIEPGMSAVLAARALAGLFLFGERRIVWGNADPYDTRDAFRRLKAIIEGCEPMARLVERASPVNGGEYIQLVDGHRIQFETLSGRRAERHRGLTVDTILLEDFAGMDPAAWRNLLIGSASAHNPQIVRL